MLAILLSALCVFAAPHVERLPDAPPPVPELPADADPVLQRGAQLYRTASCVGCHSPPFADAEHLGGGRDLPTAFGVFYAPNISPDPEHGIGAWTEADFVRAMRDGRSPTGRRYWPTFPYMTYTRMTDDDLHALWVYLRAGEPSEQPSLEHQVRFPYRLPGALAAWRGLNLKRGPFEVDPAQSEVHERGRYLVQAVSYCDQCHTPRGALGGLQRRRYLAGGANPGKADVHPNLTPDPDVGLGGWTLPELATYLATATPPDGTPPDPDDIMAEKVRDSFSYDSDDDRLAIATYLAALPPNDFDPASWRVVRRAERASARKETR